MALFEVQSNCRGAILVTAAVEVLADRDVLVLVLELLRGALRAGQRPSRPRRETRVALDEAAPDQGYHPAAGRPVLAGNLAFTNTAPPIPQSNAEMRVELSPPEGSAELSRTLRMPRTRGDLGAVVRDRSPCRRRPHAAAAN